jgi:membrane protein
VADGAEFPWRNTALTLRERFREDRLGITASSLTFTTTISLVPLFTVALAIFSAFPMFARLQTRCSAGWCKAWCPTTLPSRC